MRISKEQKLKALRTALRALRRDTSGYYGLCNIIPYIALERNDEFRVMRVLMVRRAKSLTRFYDWRGVKLGESEEPISAKFQWKPDDKASRIKWLEKQIEKLK